MYYEKLQRLVDRNAVCTKINNKCVKLDRRVQMQLRMTLHRLRTAGYVKIEDHHVKDMVLRDLGKCAIDYYQKLAQGVNARVERQKLRATCQICEILGISRETIFGTRRHWNFFYERVKPHFNKDAFDAMWAKLSLGSTFEL